MLPSVSAQAAVPKSLVSAVEIKSFILASFTFVGNHRALKIILKNNLKKCETFKVTQ